MKKKKNTVNYLLRYTYPLFESICVSDGRILREEAHRDRFRRSYLKKYRTQATYDLLEAIELPGTLKGTHKLRISYNRRRTLYTLEPYEPRQVNRLQLVTANDIRYELKSNDRRALNRLYNMRQNCDDVLICRNGHVTDTSYSNIAFLYKGRWFTPSDPLLEGTHRSVLLDRHWLEACPIRVSEVPDFEGFQLINAMMEFRPEYSIPITHIQLKP